MSTKSQADQLVRHSSRVRRACPKCGGDLFRIPRRSIDRAISAFVPVRRFGCRFFSCHWQGNVRLSRQESAAHEAAANSTNELGTRAGGRKMPRTLPKSFVVNMCLVGAGLVAVFVVTTTDFLSDPEVRMVERRKNEVLVAPKIADRGTRIALPAQSEPK